MSTKPAAPLTVESLGDGRYRVAGGAEPHIVTGYPTGPLCDCKSFRHGGRRSCKHVSRVSEIQERGEAIPPAVEVPSLGDGGPGDVDRDVPPPEPTSGNGNRRNEDPAPAPRFRLYTSAELLELPPPQWLLHDHLQEDTLAVLYGPPGIGKSFLALAWALSISTHEPWLGHDTRGGPVLYVAAEGGAGLVQRVQVYRDAHELAHHTEKIRFAREPVNLLEAGDVDGLLASCAHLAIGFKPALVVLDTMARCMAGGDENSAQDVGRVIAAVDRIRRATSATVLLVHHTGKDGLQERGSSALRGGADTMFSLKGEDGVLTLENTKQKDAPLIAPQKLRLHTTGGSCLIEPRGFAGGPVGLTRTQRTMLETLRDVQDDAAGAAITTAIRASKLPDRTAYLAVRVLKDGGYIAKVKRRYVVTPLGDAALLQTAGVLQ